MILSEYTRRWYEVRFYYFCLDIYRNRKNILDIIYAIEAICQIGDVKVKDVKRLTSGMINDPYYKPNKIELVLLASMHGVKDKDIAEYLKISKQAVNEFKRRHQPDFYPTPRYSIEEDIIFGQFLEQLDTIKKAGI